MSYPIRPISKQACLLICLLVSLFFSCSNRRDADITDHSSEIKINNALVTDTIDLSEMVDSVNVLKLTDAPQKSLAHIDQVYALGDNYIAIDAVHTKRVNAYASNGTYIKTIMENGPWKTDALNVTDCYVNEKNELIVYDFAQMKLSVFDSNLNSKKNIKGKILFNYKHIASLPGTNNFVAYSSYNGYNAVLQHDKNNPSSLDILDSNLNLSKKNLFYPAKFGDITLIAPAKSFFPFNDSLRFFRAYDPYIYSLRKDGIEKRYKIVYQEGNIPADFLDRIVEPNLRAFQSIGREASSFKALFLYFKGYTCPDNWLEANNIVYLSSMVFTEKKVNQIRSIIVHKNKTPEVITAKVFAEKEKFKLAFPNFNGFDKNKNEFIGFCTGSKLKKYLYKNSPLIKSEDIVDDSFYLVKVKFK